MIGKFESKTHLLAILDNMPYMAWYKDVNGKFISINQSFADSIGKPKDEIIGKTDFEVWPHDLAVQYVQDDKEVMNTRTKKTVEERISDQAGSIWFETFKSPVFDNDGNVIGTIGIAKDISIRKHFEIELENQKRFIKSMIDAIPDLIFYKDVNSTYLGCNHAFAKQFIGLSEEEIVGKTDADFIKDTELAKFFIEQDKNMFAKASTHINEERIPLQDGSMADLETMKTPFFNEAGEVAGLIGIARNITARKNTERAINAQRNYLEMLLKTIPSAVYTVDNNGFITSWNDMAAKITGYSALEVMGKSIDLFLFHPCRENCSFCINGTTFQELNLNCQIKNKNGDMKYLLKNVDALKNENGEIIGRIECFDDITERMIVEKQLTESELRLQLATDNANIGLWDWRVQTEETVFNEQWAEIIGYTLSELQPVNINTWIRFTHPEDLEKSNLLLKKHFEGESDYYENEIRLKHKNGHWVWVLDRGRVIEWDSQHKPIRMVGTHIDITSRKITEDELKTKEKLLSSVALSIKELIGNRDYFKAIKKCFELIGNATNVDRVYLFINNYDSQGKGSTSQMVEWNSGESIPQLDNPELQSIPFEDLDSFLAPLMKGESFYGIVRELNNDRTRELLESQDILSVIVLPVYVRGVFWGFIGFDECKYERPWTESEFSILSAFSSSIGKTVERSLIEKELEAARQSAETANSLKSQFVASMSHEIRTPMHAILGYTSLMKDIVESEQSITYLNAIQKAGNTLMNLINDILDLSKIEAGKLELNDGFVNIRQIFDDIRDIFTLKLQEKNIALNMKFDDNIPEILLMDEVRIRQVLFNLVGNAVKFTEKGSIDISAIVKNFDSKNQKLNLVFEVKDTGIGIPEDQYLLIFEPFKQKDGQSTKKYGGTGLGLSISKRLIDMMGGSISLYSKLNVGTTFVVSIPDIPIGKLENTSSGKIDEDLNNPVMAIDKPYLSKSNEKSYSSQVASPEMIEMLEQLKENLWLDCTVKNRINDIRKLANNIMDIGSSFKHDETIQYAIKLQTYINTFNLKSIKEYLLQYPTILDRFKESITKGGTSNDKN